MCTVPIVRYNLLDVNSVSRMLYVVFVTWVKHRQCLHKELSHQPSVLARNSCRARSLAGTVCTPSVELHS